LAHVGKNDLDAAQVSSENIKRYIRDHGLDEFYLSYFYLLQGEIHAALGNGAAIREALEKCSGIFIHSPEYINLLAVSCVLQNEYDLAIEHYQTFKKDIGMARYGNDRLFFYRNSSLADYKIGKIFEQKGNKAKAIEHYDKFLTLWKDADPGIAEVEDARKRLAGLKS
jgi:tetratricopeptide (TPR) repeat protein